MASRRRLRFWNRLIFLASTPAALAASDLPVGQLARQARRDAHPVGFIHIRFAM
jgi:hypothetical protein